MHVDCSMSHVQTDVIMFYVLILLNLGPVNLEYELLCISLHYLVLHCSSAVLFFAFLSFAIHSCAFISFAFGS